eukprot:Awhi_evm1s35
MYRYIPAHDDYEKVKKKIEKEAVAPREWVRIQNYSEYALVIHNHNHTRSSVNPPETASKPNRAIAVTPQATPTIFTSHVTTSSILSQDYGSSNGRHSRKSLIAHVASTTFSSSAPLVSPFVTPSRPIRAISITPNATTSVSQ